MWQSILIDWLRALLQPLAKTRTYACYLACTGSDKTNTTVTLPDTSSGSTTGVWTDYLHSTDFDFPTSGTDQIVTVRLSGKVHMAGDTLTLAALAFIENES
jgi:hypothetical protein